MAIFKGAIVPGILYALVGVVLVRVWCEITLVFFKSNENLKKMADKQ